MRSIILFLLFAGCGSVMILPRNNNDDLFNKNGHLLTSSNSNQYFVEITASEIHNLKFDEIYLFANWCPHCIVFLSEFHQDNLHKILLVSTNYDIPYLNKHFPDIDTFYILSNSKYGSVESDKIISFTTELLNTSNYIVDGVPQRFKRVGDSIYRVTLEHP
jgi:hypothetical protein